MALPADDFDPEAYAQAADMIRRIKDRDGIKHIATADYLKQIEAFYNRIVDQKRRIKFATVGVSR